MSLFNWIKNPLKAYRNCSPIWKGFIKTIISLHLCWKVGNSRNIMVGIDPIIGLEEDYKLSSNILNYLVDIGYTTLAQIRRPICRNRDCSYWLSTKYLGLIQESTSEWEAYIKNINLDGCRISMEEDSLIWSENLHTGNIYPKSTY